MDAECLLDAFDLGLVLFEQRTSEMDLSSIDVSARAASHPAEAGRARLGRAGALRRAPAVISL